MRVITGIAKGKRLVTAEGLDVRPTPEKVKEGLFSSIQFDIEGRKVLDLFGGSGQLGIEALSRGAESAVFVDLNPVSVKNITKNLETTGFTENSKVIRGDFAAVLMGLDEKFDLVFLDPPYASDFWAKALKLLDKKLSTSGRVFCEHPDQKELEEQVGKLVKVKTYRYGKVCVSVYERKSDGDE